jgi:hypothetical protein
MKRNFDGFEEFYRLYLSQHRSRLNRRCHVAGTIAAGLLLGTYFATRKRWLLLAAPASAYALAWFGHFVFERNTPTAFGHPLYSLRGDLTMARDVVIGELKA